MQWCGWMHARALKVETYSLSIRVGDIEVPPPSLRAGSGGLAADSLERWRDKWWWGGGEGGEGEKIEEQERERESTKHFNVLVIEADPEHRPPAPEEELQKPHYTWLPWWLSEETTEITTHLESSVKSARTHTGRQSEWGRMAMSLLLSYLVSH